MRTQCLVEGRSCSAQVQILLGAWAENAFYPVRDDIDGIRNRVGDHRSTNGSSSRLLLAISFVRVAVATLPMCRDHASLIDN